MSANDRPMRAAGHFNLAAALLFLSVMFAFIVAELRLPLVTGLVAAGVPLVQAVRALRIGLRLRRAELGKENPS